MATKKEQRQLKSEPKQDFQDIRDELRGKVDGLTVGLRSSTRNQLDVRVSQLEEKLG